MDGKEHYRAGERALTQVVKFAEEAATTGHISDADKNTIELLNTLGTLHFAAATAHALNFGRVPVRSVTG